ncbi:hypothetical protein [Thioclava sp. F28-4]|uniref:hypothetical protein n=1 Tax=Thioclava sp. F28-4 TaxID=1915315 RepID=UPI0011BA5F9D|nr:hypothetical protein [Thioclava sp. F28-4]
MSQPMALEPFMKYDRSRLVLPGKTPNGFAQIKSQNLDVFEILFLPPMPATIAAGWWEGGSSHYISRGPVSQPQDKRAAMR